MTRRLLHVLLVLTLTLNGISAPWAMGRMNHEGHGAGSMHASEHAAHTMQSAHPSMAHADHSGHAPPDTGALPTPQAPDAMHSGDCCDGITCQCGCVLPPVVSYQRFQMLPIVIEHARYALIVGHVVERRQSPPFRPPAAV